MKMTKVLALVAAAGIIAAASTAFAAQTIVGSKHDLSFLNTAQSFTRGTNTQICVYCHTPHNAVQAAVLWNRSDSGLTFKLYSGVGMENKSFSSGLTGDSTSLFCMSCHDGSTDMNEVAHSVNKAGLTTGLVAGDATLGGADLSLTHPINFPVALSNSQADLWVGSGAKMGGIVPGVITAINGFPLFKSSRDGAAGPRTLECGSCHAVHDSQNKPFLRYTMDKSALCLGCHNK